MKGFSITVLGFIGFVGFTGFIGVQYHGFRVYGV